MMTLTAKRIEHLASSLAASNDADVTTAIKRYDVETKVAIRLAIELQREAQGIQAKAADVPGRQIGEQDGSYWLRRMGVTGPITQREIENRMTAAGLEPHVRIECKLECVERRWMSKGLGYRLSAAGLATDQVQDDSLASDHSVVNYGPEALSLQMAGLYRRANLLEDHSYSKSEVDLALSSSDLSITQRMAIRHSLAMRHQLRASGVDTLATLNERLTALRMLQRQRPSMEGKGVYTMRASAAGKPASDKILRDHRTGKPVTLTFLP